MYDLIIAGGEVFDGLGRPPVRTDVAVKRERIVRIGALDGASCRERIDGRGLVVTPGFVDIHCHPDGELFTPHGSKDKILQGVTTETCGHCGMSLSPASERTITLLERYIATLFSGVSIPWNWRRMDEFLDSIAEGGTRTNLVPLVGHGTVRIAVMGFDDRAPSPRELAAMEQLVMDAMDAGAFGLSSGLVYPPGIYSQTSELVSLCRVAARKGGIYATHIRSETDDLVTAVQEAIKVGEAAGIPVQIAHHKAAGPSNWGKTGETLAMMTAARSGGVDVNCDVYPYTATCTMLGTLLPPWAHEGGLTRTLERLQDPACRQRIAADIAKGIPGWDNQARATGWDQILLGSCEQNADLAGLSFQEIADLRRVAPVEALMDILLEEAGKALMIAFMMNAEEVAAVIAHPLAMIASDSIVGVGQPHPRYFGTFPRLLGKYVREERVLTLAEAIRKITSMPAEKLGLKDRGVLKAGAYADIAVFDPERIEDRSTYREPRQPPVGMEYVVINGQLVVTRGKYQGVMAGRLLRS